MIIHENLHDAVLVDLNFNWMEGSLRCALRRVSERPRIEHAVFSEVRKVIVTSDHPWGMSSSINSVRKISLEDGFNFIIEMQSGDNIEIYASKMVVE